MTRLATPESVDPVVDSNLFQRAKYFKWLCNRVHIPVDRGTYDAVFHVMFATEYVWVIGNDDNRISDGRLLRQVYLNGSQENIYDEPVKFLEVLLGLSERVAFLVNEEPGDWAWKLMTNLGLDAFPDPFEPTDSLTSRVAEILERVVWRTYNPDGNGGFFPLTNPEEDQRRVEIWYQMTAYIEQTYPDLFDM